MFQKLKFIVFVCLSTIISISFLNTSEKVNAFENAKKSDTFLIVDNSTSDKPETQKNSEKVNTSEEDDDEDEEEIISDDEPEKDSDKEPEKESEKETSVSLVAVGDNLYHTSIMNMGKTRNGFNYDFMYDKISSYIKEYDIAVVNQETPLVSSSYSSYPCFGTPKEVGNALINAGFNLFLTATNHSMDKNVSGIYSTMNFFKNKKNIKFIGTNDSFEKYNEVKIIEKNNIKIALLNYTYGLNGFRLPKGKEYLVNLLNNKEKIKKDLIYAEKNADVTIVFPHWGIEYEYVESKQQREMAHFFTKYGADIIIGAHPHVVQPTKYIKEGNNKSICFYSLGNFVSGQGKKPRLLGSAAELKIVRNKKGKISIKDVNATPLVMHRTARSAKVIKLKDYNDKMAKESILKPSKKYMKDLWKSINKNSFSDFSDYEK